MRSWCTQRIANIGFIAIIILVYVALQLDHPSPTHPNGEESLLPAEETPVVALPPLTKAQLLFILYTFAAHILALAFPIRLCWATYSITERLRHASAQRVIKPRPRRRSMKKMKHHDDGYEASLSSFSESSSSSVFSDSTDESSPEREQKSRISTTLHTIIIPNYKEELDTLRETLEVLSCHRYSRSTYEVYFCHLHSCISKLIMLSTDLPRNGTGRRRCSNQGNNSRERVFPQVSKHRFYHTPERN